METQAVWQESFVFFSQMPVVVEPVEAYLSTDAGLLPIRQLDEALGLTKQFPAALNDPRIGSALLRRGPYSDKCSDKATRSEYTTRFRSCVRQNADDSTLWRAWLRVGYSLRVA